MAKTKSRKAKRAKWKADFIVASNGHAEIVPDTTESPFWYGAGNSQRNVSVLKNRRTSPIAYYRHAGIIAPYQAEAGLQFEAFYHMSKSSPSAMDFTNEPVDGGGAGDVFQDRVVNAIKALIDLQTYLGLKSAYQILEQVCGHHQYVKDLAVSRKERDIFMAQLREALDAAALHWGFITVRNRHG